MEIELPLLRSDADSRNRASGGYEVLVKLGVVPVVIALSLFAGLPTFIAVLVSLVAGIWGFRMIRRSRGDWIGQEDVAGRLVLGETSARMVKAGGTSDVRLSDLSLLDLNHNHIQGRSTGYRAPIMNGIISFDMVTRQGSKTTVKGLIQNDEQFASVHSVVLHWRRAGIAGKDTFGPDRTMSFGLHVNARYAEINPPNDNTDLRK